MPRSSCWAGVFVNVLGLVLMAFGTSLVPILIGRFISGVGIGAAAPAIKRIVVLADPANLGRNMGRLLAADVFGFAMGPAISAVLVGPFGIPAPFLVVAAVTLVLLPMVARVDVVEAVDPPARRFAVDLLSSRPFAGAVMLGAVATIMRTFDVACDVVHKDLGTSGLGQQSRHHAVRPAAHLARADRWSPGDQTWGPFKLGSIGLFFAAAIMITYGFLPVGGLIFALAMVHAVSDGLTISSAGVAVSMVVPADRQAAATRRGSRAAGHGDPHRYRHHGLGDGTLSTAAVGHRLLRTRSRDRDDRAHRHRAVARPLGVAPQVRALNRTVHVSDRRTPPCPARSRGSS